MGRPVINTPEFIAEVRVLWDAGLPPAVIGGRMGRTAAAVCFIAFSNRFPRRKGGRNAGRKPLPASLVEAVRRKRAAGSRGVEIASALGISVSWARIIARREGMPRLKSGPRVKSDRNAAIRESRAAGARVADIAARHGISRQRVNQIARADGGAEKPA